MAENMMAILKPRFDTGGAPTPEKIAADAAQAMRDEAEKPTVNALIPGQGLTPSSAGGFVAQPFFPVSSASPGAAGSNWIMMTASAVVAGLLIHHLLKRKN